jgi:O-antigen ligase
LSLLRGAASPSWSYPIAIIATLGWGVLLFGAPYPWTYLPLLAACLGVGAWGLLRSRDADRLRHTTLLVGLIATAGAALVQLIPIPQPTLARVSPSADAFLRRTDVDYGAAAFLLKGEADRGGEGVTSTARHPLSIDPAATRRGLLFLACFGIFLVGAAHGLHRSDVKRIAAGLLILGTLVAVVGIAHRGSGGGKIYGLWQPRFSLHPFGPFVNRNHFAGFMLMCIPVSVGYLSAASYRAVRRLSSGWHARMVWLGSADASRLALAAFGLFLMVFSLALTLSRSGLACFAVSLPVMIWLAMSCGPGRVDEQRKSAPRRLVATVWIFLLLAIVVSWAGLDAIATRFASTEGGPLGGRMAIWSDSLRILRDFPWTGTGLNTFGAISTTYQTSDLQFRYLELHNDYLQIAVEGGLLLIVPALVLMGGLVLAIWRVFSRSEDDVMTFRIRAGAVTGLIAIALQEIVDFSLQMPGNAAFFTLLAAIALHEDRDR